MIKKSRHLEEHVMVFPTSLLMEAGYFQGLSFETKKYTQIILEQKNYKFMRRRDAEVDPNYKQLIPYVILKHRDSIFTYRRGKLLTEERLLGNYSIGIGGHISINDPNLFGIGYEEGVHREIKEEIGIKSKCEMKVVALMNDDANEVGKVHFGIIHIAILDSPSVMAKEKSINEAKFLSILELKKNIYKFENWSKICINEIEKLLAQI
ncbi:MAG: phosphoesterase [Patescibacteria group bacterium]|nr:phosphoesterase [Patescibacteria group bacterium]